MKAVELRIQHVRKPRQRMPIGHFQRLKRPFYVGNGETGVDVSVLDDVIPVVKVHKIIVKAGPVREERECYQNAGKESELRSLGRRSGRVASEFGGWIRGRVVLRVLQVRYPVFRLRVFACAFDRKLQ